MVSIVAANGNSNSNGGVEHQQQIAENLFEILPSIVFLSTIFADVIVIGCCCARDTWFFLWILCSSRSFDFCLPPIWSRPNCIYMLALIRCSLSRFLYLFLKTLTAPFAMWMFIHRKRERERMLVYRRNREKKALKEIHIGRRRAHARKS